MSIIKYQVVIAFAVLVISFIGYQRWHSPKLDKNNISVSIQEAQEYIDQVFATKTELFADEGVVKLGFPRTDLKVTMDGWPLHPFMGVASWVSFQKGSKPGVEIMAMGDIALLEDEVNHVMSAALNAGINVTALHNHFFADNPKMYFMHIEAEGSLRSIVRGIDSIFSAIKNVPASPKLSLPPEYDISGDPIEKIISVKGAAKDGMFKIVIGRKVQAGCGCWVGKNMGINSWIAFGGTDENAIVDGDIAVLESELQLVLKAFRKANIKVVAIHNHMIYEKPRMIFVHYYGQGKAIDLAQGLKYVLDQTSMFHNDKK